jgi:hypothetical protein
MGTLLLDGMFGGTWRIRRDGGRATLEIDPFESIPASERPAVLDEGARLLAFAAAGAEAEIVVRAPTS